MKTFRLLGFIVIVCTVLTACAVKNPSYVRPYLCHNFPLKQTMYICQVQYRYPSGSGKDRYFIRDPHGFSTVCEDSMFSLAYRTKPSVWPQGHGDFWEKEWFVAKLPPGTLFSVKEYDVPNDGSQVHPEAIIIIQSGKYKGLQAEWELFDFTHEIDRPIYPYMPGK
ncbi:MAG: hypothetical protein V4501_01965 [Pseudomonadota bacterium]